MFKLKNIIRHLYYSPKMTLSSLPDELLHHIFAMDGKRTSLRSIKCRMVVHGLRSAGQRLLFRVAATRLQLWYRLFSRFQKQRHLIEKSVAWMFSMRLAALPSMTNGHRPFSKGVERMPYACAFYAPVVQGGMCRGCTRFRDSHPFSEWVVSKALGMG